MKYAIVINAYSNISQSHHSGLRFAAAVHKVQQQLGIIFFQNDAVNILADKASPIDADSQTIRQAWQQVASDTGCALLCCSQAIESRALVNAIKQPFCIAGLMQVTAHYQACDRLLIV